MLGLDEAELWSLAPVGYAALLRTHERLQERRDWRMGMICTVIGNTAPFIKRRKPFQPEDFMPTKRSKKATPAEGLDQKILAVFGAMGAKREKPE